MPSAPDLANSECFHVGAIPFCLRQSLIVCIRPAAHGYNNIADHVRMSLAELAGVPREVILEALKVLERKGKAR